MKYGTMAAAFDRSRGIDAFQAHHEIVVENLHYADRPLFRRDETVLAKMGGGKYTMVHCLIYSKRSVFCPCVVSPLCLQEAPGTADIK